MGRNLAPIDGDQVFKLAKLGCTQTEIAEIFDVHPSTISKRFSQDYANARGMWKMSIRRAQTRRAVRDGSDAMLIHLGKAHLGQGDKLQVTTREQPKYIDRAHNLRDKQITHANGNGHTNGNGMAPESSPEAMGTD